MPRARGRALVGLASAVQIARLNSATSGLGTLQELYVIAAAVIGGTSMAGGIGTIFGAVLGGFLVGTYKLDFSPATYLTQTERYLETIDVVSGLIKAAVFGFIVALMGCFYGMNSARGAQGGRDHPGRGRVSTTGALPYAPPAAVDRRAPMTAASRSLARTGVPPAAVARWALVAAVAVNVVILEALFLANGTGKNPTLTVAKFLGLHAAMIMMFQLVLVARLPWLDRRIGMDRLTSWHRWVGFALLWTVLAHATVVIAGYTVLGGTSPWRT